MLTNGGRPLGELTAEEIDQLINQKSAEMDNMKHVHRKDSGDLNSTNRLRENIRGRHYLNSELESSKPRFVPNLSSIPKVSYNKMPNRPQTGRADYSKKDSHDVNRYDVTAQNDRPADRRETAGRSASASLVDRYDRNVSAEPRDLPKDIVRENSTQRVKQEAQSIVIALKEAAQKNREIQSELNKYRDSASRLEEELILAKERENTLKDKIKELNQLHNEEKRHLSDRIRDLEHDRTQTLKELQFKDTSVRDLERRLADLQSDLENVEYVVIQKRDAYRSQEEELRQMHIQNCRLLKSSEDELAAVKAESTDLEVQIRKEARHHERTEVEISNQLIEAEQSMQMARAELKESESKANRMAEQYAKEREFLEKRYMNEKEKNKDLVHSYEQRMLVLKDELKLAEKDISLLKKSNSFLEKRVVKREKGSQFDESLKNEMKKLLGISIELTCDIMSFAKGEKHRQLNIEKKYKKIRSELNQKVTGIGSTEFKEPEQKSLIERKRSSSRKTSNRHIEVRGVMNKTIIKRVTPKNKEVISARSRGGSLTSKHSQGSKASYRSTSKGKVAARQTSAQKSRPESRSNKKKVYATDTEKSIVDDTQYVGVRRAAREVDSIGDLSRDLSRIDGRVPMFFEGSDAGRRSRERPRRGYDNMSNLQSSPINRAVLTDEQVPKLSREEIKQQIRESEDQIIALKKVYREKLEKRQISSDVTQMARQREELTHIANDIETRSQNLLQMRKQLREAVLNNS